MTKGSSAIEQQMNKIFKHTRAGSYATRDRYTKSCRSFIRFLDENYKMKNLRNLQDKHLVAYVQHRQEEGISSKTIKNDLGAIRYMHDLLPNAKYELASNARLKQDYNVHLEKTVAIDGDRAWTEQEYENMQLLLSEQSLTSKTAAITKDVMVIERTMGLRVAEAVCMRRSQAESALRTGIYQVQSEAKNGRWREVPLSAEVRDILTDRLLHVERGGRVFVSTGEKAHHIVNQIEKHLERYRGLVETSEGRERRSGLNGDVKHLTFHGLRYNYAQERMAEEMAKGFTWDAAAQVVTKEIGHNRIDVIKIYTMAIADFEKNAVGKKLSTLTIAK